MERVGLALFPEGFVVQPDTECFSGSQLLKVVSDSVGGGDGVWRECRNEYGGFGVEFGDVVGVAAADPGDPLEKNFFG